MDFTKCYQDIINSNPEFVSKETMCKIMKIGKSTGYKLLKKGDIPFQKKMQKSIHYYDIAVIDIVSYMYQKAKIYQTGCDYEIKMRAFLENKLAAKKDMLKISDVSHMLGYCKETIRRWIENHYLNAYLVKQHIFIAKEDLITFMLSEHFGEIRVKSEAHKAMLDQYYNN